MVTMHPNAARVPFVDWSVIGRTAVLIWVPGMVIWYIVLQIYPGPKPPDIYSAPLRGILFACLFAPYIETQGMRFLIYLLGRWTGSRERLKWYVALIFGALHADSETWGLHAIWGFYVMCNCYLEQRNISTRRAVWMTVAVHGLCNLLSYFATLIERAIG